MEWIKTKDSLPEPGVKVIALGKNDYGKARRLRAYFAPRWTIEDNNEYEAGEYSEEKDKFFLKEGWYECNEHDEINWLVCFPITHWMPLPKLPDNY